LGPETRYLRRGVDHYGLEPKQEYFTFRRIDPTPLTAWEFVQPLQYAKYARVVIPTVAYSMIYLFGSVLVSVEVPQLFGEKFHFNVQQLGLQFLGIIIGPAIGEQMVVLYQTPGWIGARARLVPDQTLNFDYG
jgi:hypothetical protein